MHMSFGKKLLYAFGQFGLVLCAYGAGKLFLSFYVPDGSPIFPVYLPQGYIAGFFTVAGLVVALNRLVDVVAGLLSGWLSDRTSLKDGRRIPFLLASAAPLALFSVLIFCPPFSNALYLNSFFVAGISILFYLFLSFYAVPYLSLLAELGDRPGDRLQLSTLLAVATALASLSGNRIYTLMDVIVASIGISPLASFRLVLTLFALVSCVCMLIPALILGEGDCRRPEPVREPFARALSTVIGDRYFRSYLLADSMFRIAAACLITGFSLYASVLLGLPRRFSEVFLLLVFFSNLALYLPIGLAARRFGKRKLLFIAFLLLFASLFAAVFAGKYPISPLAQAVSFSMLFSIPYAAFSAIPNAVVADLAVAAERKTGSGRAGLYFGVHSFVVRSGEIVAGILFPFFAVVFGRQGADGSPGGAGLRMSLVVAAAFAFIGFVSLFGYREKEVMAVFDRKD